MANPSSNARTKFVQFVKDNGWVLDPGKTYTTRSDWGRHKEETTVQNPHAFKKDAAHGGVWMIELDYSENGGYRRSTGNTLRGVAISYRAAPGEPELDPFDGDEARSYRRASNVLRKPGNYDRVKYVWDGLENADDAAKDATMRERAEKLVRNPDLAIWLIAKTKYESEVRAANARAAAEADRLARAQPMPVLVTTAGWNSDWKQRTRELQEAATALYKADGKSDLPRLVADAYLALDAITAVLTEGAREESQDLRHILAHQTAVVGAAVEI